MLSAIIQRMAESERGIIRDQGKIKVSRVDRTGSGEGEMNYQVLATNSESAVWPAGRLH